MGTVITKHNRLSPEPSKRGNQVIITTHLYPPSRPSPQLGTLQTPTQTPTHLLSTPPPPLAKSERQDNENAFLEAIANGVMERVEQRRTFQNGTTYGGLDLRLEVDCVDVPAQEVVSEDEESDDAMESAEASSSDFVDDGYYNSAEKVLYEKPKPKPDNTQFIVNWKKGTLLGSGGFGKVYLGMDNDTGMMFAVKEIMLGGDSAQQGKELKGFKQEVAVMKNLHHENIVQYLGTVEDGNALNIFLEYVPGGSISVILSKFGSLNEQLVRRYTRQILLGLEYLHSHHIIHRDIKGANILVDNNGVVKLADFGASKQMELLTNTGNYHSLKGTPYWMAPEVIRQAGYGRQCDIWSVGCTVIEMATGRPPFHEFTDQVSVLFHIASSNSPPPIPQHLSPLAQDFLLRCFERNPMNRPNASRLLEHPFLAGLDGPTRKTSGGGGGGGVNGTRLSPKPSHQSFSLQPSEEPPRPVQFAKPANENRPPIPEEPRGQPSPRQGPSRMATPAAPPPQSQPDADNLIEEPTWTWSGDKKLNRFRFTSSANDITPPASLSSNSNNGTTLKRGESMGHPPSSSSSPSTPSSQDGEPHSSTHRPKRAISGNPPPTLPPLPLDSNAPPVGRLGVRRHSALEGTIRDPGELTRLPRGLPGLPGTSAPSGGLSTPSTPTNAAPMPPLPRFERESSGLESVPTFSNHNLANFNNSFDHSFNSINNLNINITLAAGGIAVGRDKKPSPKSPRKEPVDEDTINKFLATKNNELLQTSTKEFTLTETRLPAIKRSSRSMDKLPEKPSKSSQVSAQQVSPKKFSDMLESITDEAPTNAKFKKKAPGVTTTTIVLNAATINGANGNGNGGGSTPSTPTFGVGKSSVKSAW